MSEQGPIQLSPLAQTALAQLQTQFSQQMQEILRMDAEAQDIDTEAYQFHQQAGVWVPSDGEDDEGPDLELMD